jgi:hypothetical protein
MGFFGCIWAPAKQQAMSAGLTDDCSGIQRLQVGEYQKAGVMNGLSNDNHAIAFDEDF